MSLAAGSNDEPDTEIPGTENGRNPFFSPDGGSVGFTTATELKTVSLSDGRVRVLAEDVEDGGRGACWGAGSIIYSPNGTSGLRAVEWNGGESKQVLANSGKPASMRWPQLLPGARELLFMSSTNVQSDVYDVEVLDLATGKRRVLKEDCLYGRYVPSAQNPRSGHLLYVINGSLYGERLDLETMKLTGIKEVLLHGLAVSWFEAAQYAVAEDGTLVYLRGAYRAGGAGRRLLWIDSLGWEVASEESLEISHFDLSPDDRTVAVQSEGGIHLLDVETHTLRRLSDQALTNGFPLWLPDGKSVAFTAFEDGRGTIHERRIDFSEPARLLIRGSERAVMLADSFSADGRTLVGRAVIRDGDAAPKFSLWTCSMGGPESEPRFIHDFAGGVGQVSISPDGQWIVYAEGGELFLERYGGTGARQSLATRNPGRALQLQPRWSRRGDRIIYASEGALWFIAVKQNGQAMTPEGRPTHIIDLPFGRSREQDSWSLNSDETRFLVAVDTGLADSLEAAGVDAVNVVFHWRTELNEKVPANDN